MSKRLLLALLLVPTGCGTMYTPPSGDATAVLTVANTGRYFLATAVFEDASECYKSLVATQLHPSQSAEVVIAAGKPLAMHFNQRGFTGGPGLEIATCDVVATFRPELGKAYSAVFGNSAKGCFLRLRAVQPNGNAVDVPVVYRKVTPPVGFTHKWCPQLTPEQAEVLR